MTKTERLKDLYDEYSLQFDGQEIVFGSGDVDAKVFLIGEAPGKDEVAQGKPFVGAAGKHLQKFIECLEVKREDLFVTNAIKYRLFKVNETTGRKSNRPAKKLEIDENIFYLREELNIIKPKLIVTLGNVPLKATLGIKAPKISEVHGDKLKLVVDDFQYNIFPLYHPASIIYNRSLLSVYQEDLVKLKYVINACN